MQKWEPCAASRTSLIEKIIVSKYTTISYTLLYNKLEESFIYDMKLVSNNWVTNDYFSAVHEKIFIAFMISSLMYMLTTVRLGRLVTPNAQSLRYKQALFITSLISTVGLIIFFLKHRLLCHDLGKKLHFYSFSSKM